MSLAGAAQKARDTHAAPIVSAPKRPEQTHRSDSYTEADIERAWSSAIKTFASDRILASVLSSLTPHHVEGDKYLLRCASQLVADKVSHVTDAIAAHIHDVLSNDIITFDIEISDADIPKTMWTDDRVLEDLMQQHPAIGDLIKRFQLRRI